MSVLPTTLTKVSRRRPRVTPLAVLGAVGATVGLVLLGSALLGSGSVAVLVVLVGAAAVIGLAIWTAPAQGSYRPGDGGGSHVGAGYSGGGYAGGWGGDGGGGGDGDGGGGGC